MSTQGSQGIKTDPGSLILQLVTVTDHLAQRIEEFTREHGSDLLTGRPLRAEAASQVVLIANDCHLARTVALCLRRVMIDAPDQPPQVS